MSKSLSEMGEEVYAYCVEKEWDPDPERQFGTEMMLIVTEVAEAMEAYRRWGTSDATNNDGQDLPNKPEGVGSEFADILIRLLHYAGVHQIDLEAEYERKMAYNRTRVVRHGGKKC